MESLPVPHPVDQPSSLFAQLRWLADAGLTDVECFWMQAGHAIYGGYRAAAQMDDRASRYPGHLRMP